MKILRVEYQHISLFNDGLVVDFTASNKVVDKSQVYDVSKTLYLQKVIAFAGINATGKTTVLRLVDFAMNLLSDNNYLDKVLMKYGLFKDNTKIIIDFIENDCMYRLESTIGIQEQNKENALKPTKAYYYKEEKIYKKKIASVTIKKNLFMWKEEPEYKRSTLLPENLKMLKNNQSIIVLITKDKTIVHYSCVDLVNINMLFTQQKFNKDIYNLFDNSIENIKYLDDTNFEITYKNSDEIHQSYDNEDQFRFLSSGTIRGPLLLNIISIILQTGGCVIIDEIEIHLNKALVELIISLFKDTRTNPKGALLIFSTHYVEILDSMERKDNIYITRKDKDFNLSITKFSDKIKRNDVKKSDILLSNSFENTAPQYALIQKVKEVLCKNIK